MSSTISTLYIFEWKCGRAGSAPTRPTYASVSPNRGYAVERRHFDVEKAARREIEELVVVSDAVGSGDDAVPRVVDRLSVEQVQSRSQSRSRSRKGYEASDEVPRDPVEIYLETGKWGNLRGECGDSSW